MSNTNALRTLHVAHAMASYRDLQAALKPFGKECRVKRNAKKEVLMAEAERLLNKHLSPEPTTAKAKFCKEVAVTEEPVIEKLEGDKMPGKPTGIDLGGLATAVKYRDLQRELKKLREAGVHIECKLNAKTAVLQAEAKRILSELREQGETTMVKPESKPEQRKAPTLQASATKLATTTKRESTEGTHSGEYTPPATIEMEVEFEVVDVDTGESVVVTETTTVREDVAEYFLPVEQMLARRKHQPRKPSTYRLTHEEVRARMMESDTVHSVMVA